MAYPCAHKDLNDHSTREADGRRLWTCSYCAKKAHWDEDWSYFGNIECSKCWTASIDEVRCGDCEATGKHKKAQTHQERAP